MPGTATNRSAALAGACSAIGAIVFAKVLDVFPPEHEVLQWSISLAALGAIFFVPFFKWVIGANFKPTGESLSLREQWQALPENYARIGIWFISGATVGALLKLVTTVL